MLIIRDRQLEAIGEADRRAFEAAAMRILKQRHADAARGLPDAYLGTLIGTAIEVCRAQGREGAGDTLDFAESLLTDDAHPLSRDALDAKAERLARDLRARDLYLQMKSLQASRDGGASAPGDAEPPE